MISRKYFRSKILRREIILVKLFRNVFIIFGVLALSSACSSDTKELDANVNTQDDTEEVAGDSADLDTDVTEESLSTSSETIADNDDYKITFERAIHVKDNEFGDEVRFIFEFENKSDKTLSLMSKNDASVDGRMVDDLAGFANPEVSAGKTGTVTLNFNSQWLDHDINQEFPKFKENLEITLEIVDEEEWEVLEVLPFEVNF